MAYLRYYRYRGDPGFFSSLGKIVKKVAGVGVGFIPGIGGVASKVVGLLGKKPMMTGTLAGGAIGGSMGGPVGAGIGGLLGGQIAGLGTLEKYAKSKSGGGGFGDVQTGHSSTAPTYHRKRPHMQVTNTRALRRAMRRVEGFAKIAKKTISFTHRVKMKSKRRR